jgi:hypothetical protein
MSACRVERQLPRKAGAGDRSEHEEETMIERGSIGTLTFAALLTSITAVQAFDDAKYPDLSGQWLGVRLGVGGQPGFDPTKAWGKAQQAPLTAEYEKVLEASLADQKQGGQGNWVTGVTCLPPGMPAMMTAYQALEFVVLPEITHILNDHVHDGHRRINSPATWAEVPLPTDAMLILPGLALA